MTAPRPPAALAVCAMVSAALVGEYSLLVMPFIVTAMVENYGISEVLAGRLVSAQLFAMAAASMGVAAVVARVPRRTVAALAALTIMLSNGLCAWGDSIPVLVAGRIGTGLGEGTLMGVAGAVIAASQAPHRVFSIVGLAVAVVASIALVTAPFIVSLYGHSGTFGMLTLCPVLVLLLVSQLPPGPVRASAAAGAAGPFHWSALAALGAFAMLWIGASGLWVFAERIGAQFSLGLKEIGVCLAVGQLLGIAGPIAADRYALRIGLGRSLVGGCLGMGGGGLVFVFGGNGLLYGVGASLLSFFIMFLVPCFRSLMARMDPNGRVVSASAAFYTLGFAIAPAAVTTLFDPVDGYAGAALFCTGAFVAGAVLVGLGARYATRRACLAGAL